ncbi:hypothetical protein FRC10_004754, partial [Ceratobasidium sp. 414]
GDGDGDGDDESVVLGSDGAKGELVRDGRAFVPLGEDESKLSDISDVEAGLGAEAPSSEEGEKCTEEGKAGGDTAMGAGDMESEAEGDGQGGDENEEGGPVVMAS